MFLPESAQIGSAPTGSSICIRVFILSFNFVLVQTAFFYFCQPDKQRKRVGRAFMKGYVLGGFIGMHGFLGRKQSTTTVTVCASANQTASEEE